MSRLTEAAIRKAIQIAARAEKQITLSDGEGRGTGRLTLVLRPMPRRVTAEWMAQQWRGGKRTKSKIGDYPAISLAEARDRFERDFARLIQQGASIKVAGDILEARLIPFGGHLLFSSAFCYHPREASKAITKEVARRKKKEPERSPLELVWECAKMALKVDRYRQIAVEKIYDFEQKKL